jgi:aspartate-semialdehyde dehydrogenase
MIYSYLTSIPKEYSLTPEEKQTVLEETHKIINILQSLTNRFKAIRLKVIADDTSMINFDLLPSVDEDAKQSLYLFLFEALKHIDLKDEQQQPTSSQSTSEIIVSSPLAMKEVIRLVDLLEYSNSK